MGTEICLYRVKKPSDQDIEYLCKHGRTPQRGRHSNLLWFSQTEVDNHPELYHSLESLLVPCTIPDTDLFNTIDAEKICEKLKVSHDYKLCSIFSPTEKSPEWVLGFRAGKEAFRVKVDPKQMKDYMKEAFIDVYVICATEVETWHKDWDLLEALENRGGEILSYQFVRCMEPQLWTLDDYKKNGFLKQPWTYSDDDLYLRLET